MIIKLKVRTTLLTLMSMIFMSNLALTQVDNDDCQFAIRLPNPDKYCSDDAQFTNVGAQEDPTFTNGCVSLQWKNGVWFSVVPKEPAMLIRVFGIGNGGTIRDPKIIVFNSCGDFLQCSPGKTVGNDELTVADLNIGQRYFIMVESVPNGEGTFKLCIDDFIPIPSPESDCPKAVILCDKSPFKIESLTTSGQLTNEVDPQSCLMEEFSSAWYKWTCDQSGSLTFTLTPNDFRGRNFESDDLDFAIYELPAGIDDCANKRIVRCMAAGANIGQGLSGWIECNGETGLRVGDPDVEEDSGCRESGDNNWLSPLDMVAGKSYALLINNFSRSGLGFAIEFGGTGTFLGPKVDFELDATQKFECDKTILFIDKSVSTTDPITSYKWNFGNKSTPQKSLQAGPLSVTYAGFGNKTAALTIETSRGCTVTKIIDFYVDACCKDTSTLDVGGIKTDPKCFGDQNGIIVAQGFSGGGDYSFSIDGINYQSNPRFRNLAPGLYDIYILDQKGCRDTMFDVALIEPDPISVDAGPSQILELGESTFLNGTYVAPIGKDTIVWQPSDDFPINGIVNPEVFPKTTTIYTFTIIDENGCIKTDTVSIRVIKNYALHAPNVFTPSNTNEGGVSPTNNFFNVWTTKGTKYVELLNIYDRWGNLIYSDKDVRFGGTLVTNDVNHGWDGIFNGKPVNPGVFAWVAKVRFIDENLEEYKGDVTVLR
jgi:PKD repeat protein